MDALALVVWTVTFLSATVMFFRGALIVVLRMEADDAGEDRLSAWTRAVRSPTRQCCAVAALDCGSRHGRDCPRRAPMRRRGVIHGLALG
jgi:hypothetical protein